ncbi:ERF family protein [Elizabethkingia anophelis]|uniref:ERF family protein n=1 Tax=Elizabethkingia anophelis TaxID=1117645 RepID=UPI0015EF3BE0|nr:ERF family protein [Elizabethkingia anophelis]MDC8024912.1 ERF family protein [Elizabethkingia anophelis]
MESKTNLYKAIISVMKAVKGIDKTLTVGSGSNAYQGVADKVVKETIGQAMEENGLAILPISIDPKSTIERWEETSQYGNNPPQTKIKQSVFTEVKTKYLLIHESGESIEIEGYGHGVDTQDKSAGKATTYALKYALLYTFMVPTGKIDDADSKHSNEGEIPQKNTKPERNSSGEIPKDKAPAIKILKTGTKAWESLVERVSKGETITKVDLLKFFDLKEVEKELESLNIF